MTYAPYFTRKLPDDLRVRIKAEADRRAATNEPYPDMQDVVNEALRIGMNILEENRGPHDQ